MNIVITQPCPPHQWAHAPTVGYYSCMKCGERVNYDDPRYAEIAQELSRPTPSASLPSPEAPMQDEVERLRSHWQHRAYLATDIRMVPSPICREAADTIEELVETLERTAALTRVLARNILEDVGTRDEWANALTTFSRCIESDLAKIGANQ